MSCLGGMSCHILGPVMSWRRVMSRRAYHVLEGVSCLGWCVMSWMVCHVLEGCHVLEMCHVLGACHALEACHVWEGVSCLGWCVISWMVCHVLGTCACSGRGSWAICVTSPSEYLCILVHISTWSLSHLVTSTRCFQVGLLLEIHFQQILWPSTYVMCNVDFTRSN